MRLSILLIVFTFSSLFIATNSYSVDCYDLNTELEKTGESLNSFNKCIKLPLMNKGYVPQGLHITKTGKAFISMYHKSPKNGKSYKNSVVVKVDIPSKTHVETYEIPNKDHVGGIAIFNKYSKFVYPKGREFCVGSFSKNSKLKIKCQKQSVRTSKRTTGFSFINYAKDHNGEWFMWAGQFETKLKAQNGMHIFGYKVSGGKISTKPTYRFYVPPKVYKVQGISIIPSYDNYTILASSSYGQKKF